jgi:hypothetical protein
MLLPSLENPQAYQGLFVIDFGDSTSVGYTAAEVAMLLEMERFQSAKVYRIHSASPDGRIELLGVPVSRFMLESGVFFYSRTPEEARVAFDTLGLLAESHPIPSRAKLQYAAFPGASYPHAAGLIYPAEFDSDWSGWLIRVAFSGGEICDAGISAVSDWNDQAKVSGSIQLWGAVDRGARPLAELIESVGVSLQRKAS